MNRGPCLFGGVFPRSDGAPRLCLCHVPPANTLFPVLSSISTPFLPLIVSPVTGEVILLLLGLLSFRSHLVALKMEESSADERHFSGGSPPVKKRVSILHVFCALCTQGLSAVHCFRSFSDGIFVHCAENAVWVIAIYVPQVYGFRIVILLRRSAGGFPRLNDL